MTNDVQMLIFVDNFTFHSFFPNVLSNLLEVSSKGFDDLAFTLPFLNPKSVKLMASLYLNFLTSMKRISKLPGHKSKNTICRGMHILVEGFLLAYFFFKCVLTMLCTILLLNPKQRFKLNVLIQYKIPVIACAVSLN